MPYLGKQIQVSLTSTDGTDIFEGRCIAEIGDLSMTADEVDVTCYGTGNTRKKMQGLIDLGSIDMALLYKDVESTNLLYNAYAGGIPLSCVLTYTGITPNETLTFSCYISALGQTQPKDGAIQQNLTLTLDGNVAPTWGVVSS